MPEQEVASQSAPPDAPPSGPARWWMLPTIGGAIMVLDQVAKYLVSSRLALGESWEIVPALSNIIRVTYSQNSGAAFGMLPQASDVFLILAIITVGVFIVSYPKLPSHATLSRVSIGLISGGALSNALDRVRFNHVIDYVHVQIAPYFSNISNFADHAITVGVILLLIDQWRAEQRQHAESKARSGPPANPLDNPAAER